MNIVAVQSDRQKEHHYPTKSTNVLKKLVMFLIEAVPKGSTKINLT